jgi:hypothetical protein
VGYLFTFCVLCPIVFAASTPDFSVWPCLFSSPVLQNVQPVNHHDVQSNCISSVFQLDARKVKLDEILLQLKSLITLI